MLLYLLAGIVLLATVITITIDYLTENSLKNAVIDNLSDADTVTIEGVLTNTPTVTASRTIKLSARDRYGNHLNDIEIHAQKSDYFYKGQKIKIKS